ncbi:amino acid transporter [Diplodia corticola]|uniref:Amino acid transporter n=1 Tax=Diplodia corticola TaxID=236234 RepID=A0A1J9R7H1_9PEZI|nr:amino acid transporter [Diplodia corticola]OJD36465.1 amino acid transporter [Diplodia corticola]
MSRSLGGYANLSTREPLRDSLELASLASSSQPSRRSSLSSDSGAASSRRLSLDEEDPLNEQNPASLGRHGRSYSVSSAFDFATNLFPLSTTAGGYTALGAPSATDFESANGAHGGSLEKHKSLTYLNGLSLVIGLIIGSGIFSSPSQVNANAGSPGAALIVWVVAGVLAWTGAASYAELGGAIPLNGGAQVYLSKIFGEWAGFLFTWCAVMVLKPGSAAIIAIIFGEYCVRAVIGPDAMEISFWLNKGVALGGLILVTFLNCVSTKLGTRSADFFMFLKFVALTGVTITGIVVAATGWSWKGDASTEWKTKSWFEGTNENISNLAVALYAGLWAFDGWDNVNYVTGEFVNPTRDLPRVIHSSLPLVILSYLLANVAYFLVLPSSTIESSNTVAVAFGSQVLGPIGSLILALAVGGSCFGALNATTFTSGRLVYAAGKEGYLPEIFGRIGVGKRTAVRLGGRGGRQPGRFVRAISDDVGMFFTPINAMLLNAGLTAVYIIIGEFNTLVTFYGVAGYTFYFFTVLGLIVLRVREPELERPYRTWITTPTIFCCVSLFLTAPPHSFAVMDALVWAGDIELSNGRSATGVQLVATRALQPNIPHAASLHFLACVDIARIPLYLAIAHPLDVYADNAATEDWFSALLLSRHHAAKNTDLPWWHASTAQSPVGILVEVRGANTETNSPLLTELLFYATSSPAAQDEASGLPSPTSSLPASSDTLVLRALPISSDLLQDHTSSATTPPDSPSSRPHQLSSSKPPPPETHTTADAVIDAEFHPPLYQLPPSSSTLPHPSTTTTDSTRKRQSVSSLFDAATERRKRARRHAGESIAAAAAAGSNLPNPIQHQQHPPKRSASSSSSLAAADTRPPSADAGGGAKDKDKDRRPLSRSPSVSAVLGGGGAASGGDAVGGRRRTSSSLGRVVVSAAGDAGAEGGGGGGGGQQSVEARNKDVISRLVMAGMRMYGLQQQQQQQQQRRRTAAAAVRKGSVASDNVGVQAGVEGDAARDEEYKLVYHQAYRGTVFAMRNYIATEPLTLHMEQLRETVDKLLAIFCTDPLAASVEQPPAPQQQPFGTPPGGFERSPFGQRAEPSEGTKRGAGAGKVHTPVTRRQAG